LICPMCGTANKMESVFCANCGARLVPLIATPTSEKEQPPAAPIKGLSLPAKPYEPPQAETPSEESASEEDWLARLREMPAEEAPMPAEQDVPAWLKPAQTPEPVASEEPLDWLKALRETPLEETPTEETPAEELPDWLKTPSEIETPPTPEPEAISQPEPTPSAPTEIEMPDWLKQTESEPEQAEIPDWLKGLQPQATPEAEPTTETVIEPAPSEPVGEAEMPDWLKQLKPQEIVAEPTPSEPLIESLETIAAAPTAQVPVIDIEGVEEIPDWLRTTGVPSTELGVEITPSPIQPALPEEVPEWVAALKPAEPKPEDQPLETSGPLAGLRGVLPLALAMAEPHAPPKLATPTARTETGQLFETILATPPVATAAPAKKAPRAWSMRPLIYLLLALAVIIPFFAPFDFASAFLQISGTPTAEFYDSLQALPANSTVLLAFEYDPSTAGEMDLQAKAIVNHLSKRNVKIIALSTLETGAPIAQRVLEDATRNATNYVYGTNYVNLGFLPGHESGLSNLATSGLPANLNDVVLNQKITQIEATAKIKNLRDLQMIVVLAGSDDALKVWMEQVQPRAGAPIVAGVSAAVEPRARAYHDTPTKQLRAVMSGLVGAAQYEVLANQPGLALVSVNVQTIAQIVLVAIIILGNLVFWIQKARGIEAK
jgi:hypothetical protein